MPSAKSDMARHGLHTLPSPNTALIGRASELNAARQLLLRDGVRLVTFTGPGGVGKTRLAIEVGAQLADHFDDGVTFVSLAPLQDAALVLPSIVQTFDLKQGNRAALDVLQEHLRDQHVLLLLDNFEHVIGAAAYVAHLMSSCSRLKVLVTSREVLRLSGEYEFVVPSLALPSPRERGAKTAALALFAERARAVKSDFDLTDANAPVVADICARLDGLPLAIELAAARVKLLTPDALLARLSHRMDVLNAGARDLPARQQTLRNAIQWSYDLLSANEQRAFRQLSVFVGDFSLEAAEAILDSARDATLISQDSLAVLSALQDKSLLRRAESASGEPRFMLLETLREFAQEQLSQHGERAVAERAHAAYFLTLAERAEPRLTGGEQRDWLARLEADHPNFRAALQHAIAGDDAEVALRTSGALWRFWLLRGHLIEGVHWLDAALAARGGAPPLARVKALNAAGYLASSLGDYAQSEAACAEAEQLARAHDDLRGAASALQVQASAAMWRGSYQRALALYDEAIHMHRALDDKPNLAFSLLFKGNSHWFAGDYARPLALFDEAMALFKSLDMQSGVGFALYEIGFVSLITGDADTARRCFDESYRILHALGDRRGLIRVHHGLARLAFDEGDLATARSHWDEALALAMELGERWSIAAALECQAALLGAQAQADAARDAAQGAAQIAAKLSGAAEALRERIGAPMPAPLRAWHTRDLAPARKRLGERAFATAWAEGRALSPEQAVALIEAHRLASSQDSSHKAHDESLPQPLSPRETDALRLLAQGMTDAQIAEQLVISVRTVHSHLNSIYNNLGVNTRSAATRFAVLHGLG